MKKKSCKHKNILITAKDRYKIPCGFFTEVEKKSCDLGQYFIHQEGQQVYCEDCGKYID